ncbi:MAG: SNF2 helicase-associated domain-containing protein, partial [Cyanobacteria bacterium J06641_5]
MATLHGSWSPTESVLFVWGEAWQAGAAVGTAYPYGLEREATVALLGFAGLEAEAIAATWQTRDLSLPSQGGKPLLSGANVVGEPELEGATKSRNGAKRTKQRSSAKTTQKTPTRSEDPVENVLQQVWQVEGCRLPLTQALQLLPAVPLSDWETESAIGDDLRFWAHLDRWVWDLLARGKFLPALAASQAVWEPLLDSSRDRERLQHFCQHMPGVCAAEASELVPQAIVLDFVGAALDRRARQQAPRKLPPLKTAAVKPWLQALALPTGELPDELVPTEIARLERVWERWVAPVRDRLARELQEQPEDTRACLWLQPPTEGKETWTLTFGLQFVDAPGSFLPATTIWQQEADVLQWDDRPIRHPQEILLRGLGLASGVCEPVATCLEMEAAPTHCNLDAIAAYEFVRARTADLRERGLGVVVPPGLDVGMRESRLGLKVTATAPAAQRLSLQSTLNLRWELAVGDRELSPEAFAALLAQRSPLVEIEGEWLALQPADVRAAQKLLDGTGGDLAELTVADALRLQAGEGAGIAKLPDETLITTLERLFGMTPVLLFNIAL